MKVTVQRILLVFVLSYLFTLQQLKAQEVTNSVENRNQLTSGIGFIGLLYLDEFMQETLFKRKAFPPIFIQYDRQLWERLSVGCYIGLEHEMQSGTPKDFDGPTTSVVYGLVTDFHIVRFSKRNFIDPYIGISFFYYDCSGLDKTVVPGLRIGFNMKAYRNLKIRLNVGAGAALIETGIVFNY
ncbi:MAG: hypothetical protein ACI9XJ_002492 [Marivirga sp.]|jgi:hypothetical protein